MPEPLTFDELMQELAKLLAEDAAKQKETPDGIQPE